MVSFKLSRSFWHLVCSLDKDLGLKTPSPSVTMSEKSEEEELLEANKQFGEKLPTDLLIKESPEHYSQSSPELSFQASENQWALDALRNCK